MSYDFSFKDASDEVGDVNMTSNVSGMWHLAMGLPMGDLDGVRCSEVAQHLDKGIKMMDDFPEAFKAMNPENNWGDSHGAKKTLKKLLRYCRAHPDEVLEISR